MQTEAPRGRGLRGHRSAPSHDLARVARRHSVRRRPAWLRLLCRAAAPLGAGTRQPRWPDRFFQARGSHGGSARGPRTRSACPRGGGPDSPAAPGAQLDAPGRGRCRGRTRWNPERRVCKARQGGHAGRARTEPRGGGIGHARTADSLQRELRGRGGREQRESETGWGGCGEFLLPRPGPLGQSEARRGASLVSASHRGPRPQPKGPRVLRTCGCPAFLITEPTRVPFQCSAL